MKKLLKSKLPVLLCTVLVFALLFFIAYPPATAAGTGDEEYVCKIGTQGYSTLQDAINAVSTDGTATIEMLAENYDISAAQTIGDGTSTENITITTASRDYRGTADTYAVLTRTAACDAITVAAGSTLTLQNITLKDTEVRASTFSDNYSLINATGTSNTARVTVNLGTGTLVTGGNNGTTDYAKGAGIYLTNATLNMSCDATISNCTGSSGSAVYVDNSMVNMVNMSADNTPATEECTAKITGCTSYQKGTVFFNGGNGIINSLTMSGNSKISGNTGTGDKTCAGALYFGGDDTDTQINSLIMSGNAEISGNTVDTARTGANAATIYSDVGAASITMSENAAIKDNTVNNPNENSAGGVVVAGSNSLTMSDDAAITGNIVTGDSSTAPTSTAGGVKVLKSKGHVFLSENINITGNTCRNGSQKADVTIAGADNLQVGNMGNDASVGVYFTDTILSANGAQFATTTATYATKVGNLGKFYNNTTGSTLTGNAGLDNSVRWGTCELTVSETTTGDGADTAKQFAFTLTGLQADGVEYTGYVYDSSNLNGDSKREYKFGTQLADTTPAINTAFLLANGETLKIEGLPVGSNLTVAETDGAVSGGKNTAYKATADNVSSTATTFTFNTAALTATTPTVGLNVGTSALAVTNTRNKPAITPIDGADIFNIYGEAAVKNFNVTGVDSDYTVNWCNSDGSTSGETKSAGTFVQATQTDGQATLTMTPSALAHAGTYYFIVIDGIGVYSNVMTYTIFTKAEYTVSVSTSPESGGTVTGGGTYKENTGVTVEATANNGYHFVKWTEDGTEVSTDLSYTFTATADRTLVAVWSANEYTITFNTDGGNDIAPITQAYNTAVTKPENPTKTYYTFAGWDKEIPTTMPGENITITAKWSKITLSLTERYLTLYYNRTAQLHATADGGTVVYTSSDPKVATVDENGIVTAKYPGTCTVTATVDGTDISQSAEINVKFTFWDWIKYVFDTIATWFK